MARKEKQASGNNRHRNTHTLKQHDKDRFSAGIMSRQVRIEGKSAALHILS
jgi:hypothetical protein